MTNTQRKSLIDQLREAMNRVRNVADSQKITGFIVLPYAAYDALYFAAYDAKRLLENSND